MPPLLKKFTSPTTAQLSLNHNTFILLIMPYSFVRLSTLSYAILTVATLAVASLFPACNTEAAFRVEGHITEATGKVLYLEHQTLNGIVCLDSLTLSASGKYSFKEKVPAAPDFYRLRLGEQLIPFSVDTITTLRINADASSFATSYTVEGSDASAKIKDIWLAQLDANVHISKLLHRYNKGQLDKPLVEAAMDSVVAKYKERTRSYILSSPASAEAYFALFQQVNGMLLYNIYDARDSKLFAAVANSYELYYPDSPRTKHLYELALKSVAVVRSMQNNMSGPDSVPTTKVIPHTVGYIDIALPNLRGEVRRLSDVAQNAPVLLCFVAMGEDWSMPLIEQLKGIYAAYHGQGLEIYMVSLNTESHIWKSAVDGLPWVNVCDHDGAYSSLIAHYNLRSLPTLFLLNKEGEIVQRIASLEEVDKAIRTVL